MRLVGIALFAAWLLAWLVAPKGEPARPTSTVAGLAITGSQEVAVAWLEVSRGRSRTASEVLHVATIDPAGKVTPRLHVAGHDDVGYRLVDAGGGRYLLVSEHRNRLDRWFEVRRFGNGSVDRPNDLRATYNASSWEVAATGDRAVLTEEDSGDGETSIHVLDESGEWLPAQSTNRTLVGAGQGNLVRYEEGRHGDRVTVTPATGSSWSLDVTHPRCTLPSGLTAEIQPGGTVIHQAAPIDAMERVVSVVGLSGGYARMARLGRWLCVDGMRAGAHFSLDPVPLGEVVDPKLVVNPEGGIAIADANDGKGALYLRQLEGVADGASPFAWSRRPITATSGDAVRGYSIFDVSGSGGAALITRAVTGETQVLFRRYPLGTGVAGANKELLLGPTRHYLPDHRPLLRWLALGPLGVLSLALGFALQLFGRVKRLTPAPQSAPLLAGPNAIEGQLALDADAPTGALRVRRGGQPMLLFIEGAEVLRASDVRSRHEPRGDAVDVASGAPIVATGRLENGAVFRGDDVLRAGPGDLVLVGCTLTEARARLATRVFASASLLGAAITSVLLLIR